MFFNYFTIKGISPLQEEVIKTVINTFKNMDNKIIESLSINKNLINNIKNKKQNIIEFPPKKIRTVTIDSGLSSKKKDKSKKKSTKFKIIKTVYNNDSNNKILINPDKSLINSKKQNKTEIKKDTEINKKDKKKKKSKVKFKDEIINNINNNSINNNNINNNNENIINANKKLDDLDLNNLNYKKALEIDKRSFFQIYLYRLKNKHLIINTFFSYHDHNLIYIKISRFLFLVCTSLAMNVIFFFDSSMHKIYLDYGKYNFIQQIPQIIYSSLVSLVIEMLVYTLSDTDKDIYTIRQLKAFNPKRINEILKMIKIKLIIYYIITFILFLFYWYLISSFCAVYNNTQIIYIKDFATSFSLGLLYPFLIQLGFTLIRIFSLREKSKFRSFL